jgi:hypothetical protein
VVPPIVSDVASILSRVAVVEQAAILGDVVPVTEAVAPTVRSDVRLVPARSPIETKTLAVAPLATKRNPSIVPSPV